ncbi:hypothetical protein CUZ89_1398 [Enterococcus xinjiangensis]|nr:hypothetical protein [Enterococcus lactis]
MRNKRSAQNDFYFGRIVFLLKYSSDQSNTFPFLFCFF